ncbi:MAG: alpha/beta hydrolase [Microgenomates group bacterium]|jgi:pimeloyl-ACP methyl ester carboxylesterase
MNNLVVIGGLGSNKNSYWKLHKNVPEGWKIWLLTPAQLMPEIDLNKASERILNFLKANNLSKVYLLGHSLGGALAIHFTVQYPEKIEHLFLVDSEGINGRESPVKAIGHLVKDIFLNEKRAFWERSVDLLKLMQSPLIHLQLTKISQYIDLEDKCRLIKVPTVLIWGEKDLLVPVWQGKRMHKLIPYSKLEVLKGMDHHWLLHSPHLLWEHLV